MAWQGDEAKLQQLCQMFAAASSPSTQVQQQIMQALNQFSQLPDFNMYLVAIFVQIPNQPPDVKQRAGLLLKTNVAKLQRGALPANMAEHINAQALVGLQDATKVIRDTAGTILATMVQKSGFQACSQTLERLLECLANPRQEVMEGGIGALGKICEDGVALLASADRQGAAAEPGMAGVMQEAQLFVTWANQRVITRMLECASPASPPFLRQRALECLNHFSLGGCLTNEKYGMAQHSQRYIEVLGTLANDTSPDILQPVCKGFACVIEGNWSCLTVQHFQVILQFMLKASQNPEYGVRLEALAVWISCANQPDSWGVAKAFLPELVPVLISNMVYADADYMILEPSQVENDNAAVEDELTSIKPRFHAESKNVDGDEDDKADRSSHDWGAEWTARKAAARSLDELSAVFPDLILQAVMPQIEQKLNHASWEHQEAGVLALGAIGVNCDDKLAQYLPAIIGLLLKLCDGQMPLLRSIACWCVGRFGKWIFDQRNPNHQQVQGAVLKVILTRCLDRNKRVQEASISALSTLEQHGKAQLVPYLNDIVEMFSKAFQMYKLINQRILYDTIGGLAWAVGPQLGNPQFSQALINPIFQKFESVPDNDVVAVPVCECVAALAQVLGSSLGAALPRVIMRSVRSINDGAMAAQMWQQKPDEYERPEAQIQMMASCCDLLSGVVEGLKENSAAIIAQVNFLSVIPLTVRASSSRAKQSGFWLIGVCATHCIQQLAPLLPELLPLCAAGLGPTVTITVNANACYAIGEISQRAPESMAPQLNTIIPALMAILQRTDIKPWQQQGHSSLLHTACATINHLRQRTALGQQWPTVYGQLPPDLRTRLQRFGLVG